jgi:hypothetical protein
VVGWGSPGRLDGHRRHPQGHCAQGNPLQHPGRRHAKREVLLGSRQDLRRMWPSHDDHHLDDHHDDHHHSARVVAPRTRETWAPSRAASALGSFERQKGLTDSETEGPLRDGPR